MHLLVMPSHLECRVASQSKREMHYLQQDLQ
jgi:hypothetical protein